jgi:beta-lactamase class A
MLRSVSRRTVIAGFAATLTPLSGLAAANAGADVAAKLAVLEQATGGRLGVAVLETGSGSQILYRADERFPMCSTFKLLASAAVLARVDAGSEHLDRVVAYGPGDLLGYAPVTKAHVAEGGMPLGDICAAALNWSDNTAANLILSAIGGPRGFTDYVRGLGDSVTRLDRNEPDLNTALPEDPRDTTTPAAMVADLDKVLVGNALSSKSRQQLVGWLVADKVGDARIRAGVPKSWRVGDKTGTGDFGTTNTIGILMPPGRKPIVVAVFYTGSTATIEARSAVLAHVGEIIAGTFGA